MIVIAANNKTINIFCNIKVLLVDSTRSQATDSAFSTALFTFTHLTGGHRFLVMVSVQLLQLAENGKVL
jgi:hypothetical protein